MLPRLRAFRFWRCLMQPSRHPLIRSHLGLHPAAAVPYAAAQQLTGQVLRSFEVVRSFACSDALTNHLLTFGKPGSPTFQAYTATMTAQSAEKMKGKDLKTKGRPTLITGIRMNSRFSASFSAASQSLARRAGTVSIQMDHILRGACRVRAGVGQLEHILHSASSP